MLPLDHVPFDAADLDALAHAWARLGFTVSPRGAYTSPDAPAARWPCRCIFLASGWLDLHEVESLPPREVRGPNGILYRADELETARNGLAAAEPRPGAFRLERHWDESAAAAERFTYFTLRARMAPVGLAVIAHHDDGSDVDPAWRDHANSAVSLVQIVFALDEATGLRHGPGLDPDSIVGMPRAVFANRYGTTSAGAAAMVFHVDSLARAEEALDEGGVACELMTDALVVPWRSDLSCAVEFRSDG